MRSRLLSQASAKKIAVQHCMADPNPPSRRGYLELGGPERVIHRGPDPRIASSTQSPDHSCASRIGTKARFQQSHTAATPATDDAVGPTVSSDGPAAARPARSPGRVSSSTRRFRNTPRALGLARRCRSPARYRPARSRPPTADPLEDPPGIKQGSSGFTGCRTTGLSPTATSPARAGSSFRRSAHPRRGRRPGRPRQPQPAWPSWRQRGTRR